MSYSKYLSSAKWQDIKTRYRKSKLPQDCYICGEERVDLHHKTYARLRNERLTDLLPLCRICHRIVHVYRVRRKSRRITLWNAARRLKKRPGTYRQLKESGRYD